MSSDSPKLWRIRRTDYVSSQYYTALVVADTKEEARMTHPNKKIKDWDGKRCPFGTWCNVKYVKAVQIGFLTKKRKKGVVCCQVLRKVNR